ncbi:hypothetical protein KUCAC02_024628, partial [Chaenocephalus aceratus]
RVSQHPLLHGDLMMLSLDWQAFVPDLLLDAGFKVCCQFQKSLADPHPYFPRPCPTPRSVRTEPCRPQFNDLTLRQCSDVRCVLVHDEDERGAVSLDVTLANARGRSHPESVTKAASPSAHASNSSPQAEVWKLTFSCSSEAAFLIKHLSNF